MALAAGQLGGNQTCGTGIEIARVGFRSIIRTVTAFSRVHPGVEVSVRRDAPGEIIVLPVIEGTEVVQGQLLARVRRRFKAAQVEQAQTALQLARSGASQLQADLALSYRELTRQRRPFERKLACVPIFTPAAARLVYIPSLLSQPLHALPQRQMARCGGSWQLPLRKPGSTVCRQRMAPPTWRA